MTSNNTIANENNLSMPPNTNSVKATSNLSQSNNNCGTNQVESTFAHHIHQHLHTTNSQAHYQSTLALPSTLNASSTFYTPHFTMQQFSPVTSSSSNPIVEVSSANTNSNSCVVSSIGNTNSSALYGKASLSNNSFCGNDDNSSTVAFMEPGQQSTSVLNASNNEDASVNSSGSGSLASSSNCSAASSCGDNGGASSSGSNSSLTSASQYELYHANYPYGYSKYRQTSEIKPESNAHYNEKYLHAFSESDIVLATKPGQMYFDPSLCHFSDEDLRPQPMNKKSRKQTVPDCLKDDKYWARRAKNNVAAKKSREQRRLKENQVLLRASYLEKQNQALRVELQFLRCEHAKLANYLPQ